MRKHIKLLFTEQYPITYRYYEITYPTSIHLLTKSISKTKFISVMGHFAHDYIHFYSTDSKMYILEYSNNKWYTIFESIKIPIRISEIIDQVPPYFFINKLPSNKNCIACYIDSSYPLLLLSPPKDEGLEIANQMNNEIAFDYFGINLPPVPMLTPNFDSRFMYIANGEKYFEDNNILINVDSPNYSFKILHYFNGKFVTEGLNFIKIDLVPRTVDNSKLTDKYFNYNQGAKYLYDKLKNTDNINHANIACLILDIEALELLKKEDIHPDIIGVDAAFLNKNIQGLNWLAKNNLYPNTQRVNEIIFDKNDFPLIYYIYFWNSEFKSDIPISVPSSPIIDHFLTNLPIKITNTLLDIGFTPSNTLLNEWNHINIKGYLGHKPRSNKKLKLIGSGISAMVYLIDDTHVLKREFVPSIYLTSNRQDELEFYKIIDNMPPDEQKHFIKLYDYSIYECNHKYILPNHLQNTKNMPTDTGICIDYILEYGGIELKGTSFDKKVKRNLSLQVLKIFQILTKYHYGYEDLHTRNLLVTKDHTLKLIDYGSIDKLKYGGIKKNAITSLGEISYVLSYLNGYRDERIIYQPDKDSEYEKYKKKGIPYVDFMSMIYPTKDQDTIWTSDEARYILDNIDNPEILDTKF